MRDLVYVLRWRLIALSVSLGALFGAAWVSTPEAHAGVLCEHRSAAHIAEHGGLKADSAWHLERGQLPNCEAEEASSEEKPRDDDKPTKWRRDNFGFHCGWRGCG